MWLFFLLGKGLRRRRPGRGKLPARLRRFEVVILQVASGCSGLMPAGRSMGIWSRQHAPFLPGLGVGWVQITGSSGERKGEKVRFWRAAWDGSELPAVGQLLIPEPGALPTLIWLLGVDVLGKSISSQQSQNHELTRHS